MERTYTTRQGDAWDAIAYRVYGSEKYTGFLMENNLQHLDIFVFGPGVILQTPELPSNHDLTTLPIWRIT